MFVSVTEALEVKAAVKGKAVSKPTGEVSWDVSFEQCCKAVEQLGTEGTQ